MSTRVLGQITEAALTWPASSFIPATSGRLLLCSLPFPSQTTSGSRPHSAWLPRRLHCCRDCYLHSPQLAQCLHTGVLRKHPAKFLEATLSIPDPPDLFPNLQACQAYRIFLLPSTPASSLAPLTFNIQLLWFELCSLKRYTEVPTLGNW